MTQGYPDFQAVQEVLAAIGVPAQASGANSIASMLASLNTVITNTQDTVNNLATVITNTQDTVNNLNTALTKLDGVISQIQTGTPGIKSPINIVSATGQSIPAGTQITLGPYTVTGLSYSLEFIPYQGAGGTIPFVTLEPIVLQVNSGNSTWERWDLPMGAADFNTEYLITGPLNGNTFKILVTNHDTVACNYDTYIESTNIPVDHSRISAVHFGSISGYSIPPNFDAQKKVIGQWYQAAIPASTTVEAILPPYNGTVSLCLRGDLADNTVVATMAALISETSFGGLAHGDVFSGKTDANGNMYATIPLPRASCILAIENTAASAQGVSIGLIGQEF